MLMLIFLLCQIFIITFAPKSIRKISSKSLSLSCMRILKKEIFLSDTGRRKQHGIIVMRTKQATSVGEEKKNSKKETTI